MRHGHDGGVDRNDPCVGRGERTREGTAEDGVEVARSEGPAKLGLALIVTDSLTVTESDPALVFTSGASVPETVPPLVFTDGASVPVELKFRFSVRLRVVPLTAEVLPIVPSFTTLPVTVRDPPAPDGQVSEPVASVKVSPSGSVTVELLPGFEPLSSTWPLSAVLPDVDGCASWLDVPFMSGTCPLECVPALRVVLQWASRMSTPGLVTGEAWKNDSPVTDGATKKVAPAIASPLRTSVHAAGTPRERRRDARMDHLLKLCESPPRLRRGISAWTVKLADV
jgi:hypothetical protein